MTALFQGSTRRPAVRLRPAIKSIRSEPPPRLSAQQTRRVCDVLASLYQFTGQHEGQCQLEVLVRNGRVRYVSARMPWHERLLNAAYEPEQLRAEVQEIDAKVGSLCAFTDQNRSQARLLALVERGRIAGYEVVLSEKC